MNIRRHLDNARPNSLTLPVVLFPHATFNAYRANAPKVAYDQIYAEALRRDLTHAEAEILAKTFSRTSAFKDASVTKWDAVNDVNWENI